MFQRIFWLIALIALLVSPCFGLPIQTRQKDKGPVYNCLNPDSYSMQLGKNFGLWSNKVGAQFEMDGLNSKYGSFQLGVRAFINVHDFSDFQAMSWQMWRANMGFNLAFITGDSLFSMKGLNLRLQLGFYHESQHVTDIFGYCHEFTTTTPFLFNNGGLRSFEYFDFSLILSKRQILEIGFLELLLGYKYFPEPSLENTIKTLDYSYYTSIIIGAQLHKRTSIYSAIFLENIENSFESQKFGYRKTWNKEPFKYRFVELGWRLETKKEQLINVFLQYNKSNGRGMDFIREYRGMGWGLRLIV